MFLVTGSSRGLGLALVKLLAERGDLVMGVSRGASEFSHPNYKHYELDIINEQDLLKLFQSVRQQGKLNCLVNNAGVALSRPALLTSADAFDKILKINLLGSFLTSREALKVMKVQGFGRIVNISSINVKLSSSGGVAYNAAKAGLENVAQTLCSEINYNEDITINNIGVSLVDGSGMVANLTDKAIQDKAKHLKRYAFVKPEEILHSIDFFASPSAQNISGQTLYFGGLH